MVLLYFIGLTKNHAKTVNLAFRASKEAAIQRNFINVYLCKQLVASASTCPNSKRTLNVSVKTCFHLFLHKISSNWYLHLQKCLKGALKSMTSSVKNRKFCYHSTLWREIHNFIIIQCTSMVQFSILNRIIFHLLKNDFLFVVVEHLGKGIGIMTLIRKSKPCVCIFFKFKPLFLWFFICSYKSFCCVTKFFSTIFFSGMLQKQSPTFLRQQLYQQPSQD